MKEDEFIGTALELIRELAAHEEVSALEPVHAMAELIRVLHRHQAELSPELGARLLQISTGIYKALDFYKTDQDDSQTLTEMLMQSLVKGCRDGA